MIVPKAFVVETDEEALLLDALFPELGTLASFYVGGAEPLGPVAQSILITEGTPVVLAADTHGADIAAARKLRHLYCRSLGCIAHGSSYEVVMLMPDLTTVISEALRQSGQLSANEQAIPERLGKLLHALSASEMELVRIHPQIGQLSRAIQRLEEENAQYWAEEQES